MKGPAADAKDAPQPWGSLCNAVMISCFVFPCNGAPMEWNCPTATLSTTNPTWNYPGSNTGFRGERPATNRLSHGTDSVWKLPNLPVIVLWMVNVRKILCVSDIYSWSRFVSFIKQSLNVVRSVSRGSSDAVTKESSDIFAEGICMMGAARDIRSKVTEINSIRVPRRTVGLPSNIPGSTPV